MLIIRNLNKGKIKYEASDYTNKHLLNVLQVFSTKLLTDIFSKNLNRDKYKLLEANSVYIFQLDDESAQYPWIYIFLKEEGAGGIYKLDKQWLQEEYDLNSLMVKYEFEKGEVIYGMDFVRGDLHPLAPEKIQERVDKYLNSIK